MCSKRIRRGVSSVAYSPSGKTIVSAGTDKTVRVWDAASFGGSGAPLQTLKGEKADVDSAFEYTFAAYSPDGKKIAGAGGRPIISGAIYIWDAGTGALLQSIHDDMHYIDCAAFSPDGKKIASGGNGRCGSHLGCRNGRAA